LYASTNINTGLNTNPSTSAPATKGKNDKEILPGVDNSYMLQQLDEAKRAKARAEQAYKDLMAQHKEAKKQLEDVDKKINAAVAAQNKLRNEDGPFKTYSKLQRKTLRSVGLGEMTNRQSLGLASVTILLGLVAIIGRVE
tara:strand:+ start:36 stop:455 length:420 start_codon:yes stop_codon:yes gene_type:complete